MGRIRVLIVDDSVVARRLVAAVVSSSPDLEVAGFAANGRIALDRLPIVNPDIVILDLEMPELDGLQTLVELRKVAPRLPVIMFSGFTEHGATATLEALTCGASDYVTKPTSTNGMHSALDQVRADLLPKIFALCKRRLRQVAIIDASTTPSRPPPPVSRPPPNLSQQLVVPPPVFPPLRADVPIEIVAIGASTGGPNALAELLAGFSADFPVPIVITQHMPALFTKLLAQRLDAKCRLAVREAEPGAILTAGSVWLAAGDHHLVLGRDGASVSLLLNQEPPENSCRPAVDVMLRSVVAAYGENTLAVILTGMGQDGTQGARAIRQCGGQVFAQDEDTSVVWGMPGSVVRNGLANRILPLADIGAALREAVASSRKRMPAVATPGRYYAT